MRAQPVELIGGFYTDDTLPWSCQDTLNWLPFRAEVAGTRTPWKLATPPGLKPYLMVGAGPIRGMHDMEGGRYVVSAQTLCRINPKGTVTPIGTIPGVGRVSMTHNQFSTGYQLLVENGQGGGGYVYTSSTGTFAKITDPAYPGSISSDYLDSYMLGVEPLGRYWFHSNLADATDYNSLDRYESEASPDRIVGLAVSQFEVVVFNQRTIEFFYNSGAQTGTFQNRRQSITRGCASRHTIAKLDNSLFWLGDDGVVYRLEGYSAMPISTRPLEKAISEFNWSEAFAFTWEDRGHKIYYLTFPDGLTFGYDVVTGLWTRRASYGLDRWRLSHLVSWGGKWYGGDFRDGKLWELAWGYYLEGDQPIVRKRVSPVLADNQSALLVPYAELVFGTGEGPQTEPQDFPAALTIDGQPPSTLVGLTYPAFSFTAGNGTGPYSFSISKGSLPPGLVLSSAGAITGAALAGGVYSFTVRVFDTKLAWTEKEFSINAQAQKLGLVIPALVFTGGYESLAAYSALSATQPVGDGALSISPSSAYAAVGLTFSPFFQLYKLNTDVGVYAASTDIDVMPTSSVAALAFHPDGLHLVIRSTVSGVIRLNVYKLEDGQYKLKSFQAITVNTQRVEWSPNGLFLAVSTNLGSPDFGFRVFKFDPATSAFTGSFSPTANQNAQSPEGFGWSRDSRYIAEWSNNRLNCWEVTGSAVLFRTSAAVGTAASGRGAHFSDDGNWIYTVAGSAPYLAVFPVNAGVIGAQITPAEQPQFGPQDSAFSSGYLAVSGTTSTTPRVIVYRCNGASVTAIDQQPQGAGTGPAIAVRWTI